MMFEINFKLLKGYFYLIIFLFVSCNTDENKKHFSTKTNKFNTIIEFDRYSHDFNAISSKDTIGTIFKFKNEGKNPLVIQYVKSSCGCTITKWPMNQIEVNKTGEIKIIFEPNNTAGHFKKNITVFYNGEKSPQKLTIKGEVVHKK